MTTNEGEIKCFIRGKNNRIRQKESGKMGGKVVRNKENKDKGRARGRKKSNRWK